MDQEELHRKLAPCGLACFTCAASASGVIREHSRALVHYLEGFDGFAERLSNFEARLKKYPEFKDLLLLFAQGDCQGCRDGVCKFPGCTIGSCAKERGVDFCYECLLFPCEKADFEPVLKAKWLAANGRMKQVGPGAYFEEIRATSHYEHPDHPGHAREAGE